MVNVIIALVLIVVVVGMPGAALAALYILNRPDIELKRASNRIQLEKQQFQWELEKDQIINQRLIEQRKENQ